jgi:predicted nuclease of predicted toxin-antitoxin system
MIVPKDNDFRQRAFVRGAPPKVIWLEVGNAGTSEIAELLRSARKQVANFTREPETSLLILSIAATP